LKPKKKKKTISFQDYQILGTLQSPLWDQFKLGFLFLSSLKTHPCSLSSYLSISRFGHYVPRVHFPRTYTMKYAVIAAALAFFGATAPSVEAHVKAYCSKTLLDGNRNVVGCEGWLNRDSFYQSMLGDQYTMDFSPPRSQRPSIYGVPGESVHIRDVEAGSFPVTTGSFPGMDKVARVRRGESVPMIWATNGHQMAVNWFWRGTGPINSNATDAAYENWRNFDTSWIQSHSFKDNEGDDVKCSPFQTQPPSGALGHIMATQPTAGGPAVPPGAGNGGGWFGEMYACWGDVVIPHNMPNGLNRFLFEWVSLSHDERYYDEIWVNVEGDNWPAEEHFLIYTKKSRQLMTQSNPTNIVIEVPGGPQTNGIKLRYWSATGNQNQQWRHNACGTIQLVGTNMCIDSTGVNQRGVQPHLWTCDCNSSYQKWTVNQFGRIQWQGTDKCLQPRDGSINSGVDLVLDYCEPNSQGYDPYQGNQQHIRITRPA
jgi:hypothetical protein